MFGYGQHSLCLNYTKDVKPFVCTGEKGLKGAV